MCNLPESVLKRCEEGGRALPLFAPFNACQAVRFRRGWMLSVVGEDQCGDDWVVVAQFDRYDLRLNRVPDPFGLGEDVVYFLIGGVDAECEVVRCAVKPLVH